jgi:branched-chain amino acid transport system ATP-binding protein
MMLEVSGLKVNYGLSEILKGVDLEVGSGDIVSLLGRNGMGKTTTLKALMGLIPANQGLINFGGYSIAGLAGWKIARRGIGYVPEGRQIFPNLTVRENLMATHRTEHGQLWNEQEIYDMFPRLKERLDNMGDQLSGGEQQMLAIGRALLTNPRLLILDEATEGLAPIIRQEIWQSLEKLKSLGQSILIVDKNINDILRIADYHYILEKGVIAWSGTSEQLENQKQVIDRYLAV